MDVQVLKERGLMMSALLAGIPTLGKNVLVAGRSKNVGMPIAMLLHTDGSHERPGGEFWPQIRSVVWSIWTRGWGVKGQDFRDASQHGISEECCDCEPCYTAVCTITDQRDRLGGGGVCGLAIPVAALAISVAASALAIFSFSDPCGSVSDPCGSVSDLCGSFSFSDLCVSVSDPCVSVSDPCGSVSDL